MKERSKYTNEIKKEKEEKNEVIGRYNKYFKNKRKVSMRERMKENVLMQMKEEKKKNWRMKKLTNTIKLFNDKKGSKKRNF